MKKNLLALSLMFVICVTSISIGAGILLTRDTGAGEGEGGLTRIHAYLPEHFQIQGGSIAGFSDSFADEIPNFDIIDITFPFEMWLHSGGAHPFTGRTLGNVIIPDGLGLGIGMTVGPTTFAGSTIEALHVGSYNILGFTEDHSALEDTYVKRIFLSKDVMLIGGRYVAIDTSYPIQSGVLFTVPLFLALMSGGTLVTVNDNDYVVQHGIYHPVFSMTEFDRILGDTIIFVEYDERPALWYENWNAGRHVVWGWPNHFKFDLHLGASGGHFSTDESEYFQPRRWGIDQGGLPVPVMPGFVFKGWALSDFLSHTESILNEAGQCQIIEIGEVGMEMRILPYDVVFSHWIVSDEWSDFVTSEEIAYRGWAQLDALWEPETFTVSFHSVLEATNLPSNFQHQSGAEPSFSLSSLPISIPSLVSFPARTFLGFWDTPNTTGGMQIFDQNGQPAFLHGWVISENTRLYARFGEGTMHTVSFNTGLSDSVISPQSVEHGTFATRPPDPVLTGHTFLNWRIGNIGGSIFDFEVNTVNGPFTLVAEFSPIIYTITFMGLEGTAHTNPATFTVASVINLQAPSQREGWTFIGWFTMPSGGTQVTQITAGTTGNQIFFAVWEVVMVTGPTSNFFTDHLPTILIVGGVLAGFAFLSFLTFTITRSRSKRSVPALN